jgi:hypothetical protein
MTTDDAPCCGTCLFWLGECHRRSPTVVAWVAPVTGVPITKTVWPSTAADEVCGDWARNPAAKEG